LFWFMTAALGAFLFALLVRTAYTMRLQRRGLAGERRETAAGRRGQPVDAWQLARGHAARGDYTAAAHALYAALLDAIAGRGEIDLHESKTIGDYLRDLVTRSSTRVPRFREFARSYEVVIYGLGFCDRDRYERLHGLAQRVVESGG
jgi:hypothetical protein